MFFLLHSQRERPEVQREQSRGAGKRARADSRRGVRQVVRAVDVRPADRQPGRRKTRLRANVCPIARPPSSPRSQWQGSTSKVVKMPLGKKKKSNFPYYIINDKIEIVFAEGKSRKEESQSQSEDERSESSSSKTREIAPTTRRSIRLLSHASKVERDLKLGQLSKGMERAVSLPTERGQNYDFLGLKERGSSLQRDQVRSNTNTKKKQNLFSVREFKR